ncbi:unnamed protein product [Arctogadus glacialis]
MAGIEQGSLAKDYAVSQWVFGRVRVSHCWYSGWLLGSVVPWGAADSLVHEGEVLSLAEFSADTHKRHKAGEQSVSLCQEGQSKRSRRKLAGTISRQSGREGEQADSFMVAELQLSMPPAQAAHVLSGARRSPLITMSVMAG